MCGSHAVPGEEVICLCPPPKERTLRVPISEAAQISELEGGGTYWPGSVRWFVEGPEPAKSAERRAGPLKRKSSFSRDGWTTVPPAVLPSDCYFLSMVLGEVNWESSFTSEDIWRCQYQTHLCSFYHLLGLGGDTQIIDSGSFMFFSFGPMKCCQLSASFPFSHLRVLTELAVASVIARRSSEGGYTELTLLCGGSASGWHHFGNHQLVMAPDIYVAGYMCQRKDSDIVLTSRGESPKSLDDFSNPSFLPSCLCGSQYFWVEDHSWLHQHPQYLTGIGSLVSSLLALDWRYMETQIQPERYKNASRYSGEHIECSSGNQYQWASQRGEVN